jgi:hypothetical protein
MPRKSRPPRPLVDGAGHWDPRVRESIRERLEPARNEPEHAFLDASSRSSDALAEHMGEMVIEAITTGQDAELENRDQVTTEEAGGPFVETTNETELADGTDEPNIEGATREPFPTT